MDQSDRRSFEEFHFTIASGLNKYLPSAPSQKRHYDIEDTDKSLPPEKRARTELSSSQQDLVAAVAQVFQGFMSMNKRPSFAPRAPTRGGFNNNRLQRGGKSHGGNKNFPQQRQQQQSRQSSRRMCENCAIINPDHREDQCPNPTDPDIANKLAAHKRACTEARKKIIRDRISASASGSQQLPSTMPQHRAHMAFGSADDAHDVNDPSGSLYDDDQEGPGEYSPPDHGKGYSAVHITSSSAPETPPISFMLLLLLLSTLGVVAYFMAPTLVPGFLGSFGIVLPAAYPGLMHVILANILFLLLSALIPMLTWTQNTSTSPHGIPVSRQFAVILLLACLSLAFADDTHGFAFTSQHNLTADESQNRCWVDSACTKSVFRSKDLLINVTKLRIPQNVSGIGNSVVTAHFQGDYPLVLRGPSGKVHLKLIKNVLISPATGANLLGTNCLSAAGVGFDVPPRSFINGLTRTHATLYIKNPKDDSREEFKLPNIHGLWSVPDPRGIGFAEIPQSAFRAFINRHGDATRSHQLRALTELELWHIRMNHAHPSKLAKLSRRCHGAIRATPAKMRMPLVTMPRRLPLQTLKAFGM